MISASRTRKAYGRYCATEVVEGATRRRVENVPLETFREAVANALIHRTWDVNANITIGLFPNKVEVNLARWLAPGA